MLSGFEKKKVLIGDLKKTIAEDGTVDLDLPIWQSIPDEKGIYAVIAPDGFSPEFIEDGKYRMKEDGSSKVLKEKLQEKWVANEKILYFGKAGGTNLDGTEQDSNLRERIRKYIIFGLGAEILEKAGKKARIDHRGGRYIWHLANVEQLYFVWKTCKNEPEDEEYERIEKFGLKYKDIRKRTKGKLLLPFANLKSGKKKK